MTRDYEIEARFGRVMRRWAESRVARDVLVAFQADPEQAIANVRRADEALLVAYIEEPTADRALDMLSTIVGRIDVAVGAGETEDEVFDWADARMLELRAELEGRAA